MIGGYALAAWQVMTNPATPLPPEWNPRLPLVVSDPVTVLTAWKLHNALGNDAACLAAPAKAAFLRRANNTACTWFRVTLGPEYNGLHADHLHLQHSGFGLCS